MKLEDLNLNFKQSIKAMNKVSLSSKEASEAIIRLGQSFKFSFGKGYGWDDDLEEGWLEISDKEEL